MRSIAFDYLSCGLLIILYNKHIVHTCISWFSGKFEKQARKVYLWIINSIDFFPMTFHRLISGIEWEKWKSFNFFYFYLNTFLIFIQWFYLFFFLQLRNIHTFLTHMFILLPHAWTYLAQKIYDSREFLFLNMLWNFAFHFSFFTRH